MSTVDGGHLQVVHRLIDVTIPREPEAAVVVLHGGASRRDSPEVSPTQLSVLRMIPVARRIGRAGRRRLAVLRLLNSRRGWDSTSTPVSDAVWAMEQIQDRLGDVPIGLVGHSLGGRAALLAGTQPRVRCVVALNPWLYPSDNVDLTGRDVLMVHGSEDRIASPDSTATVARRLRRHTTVEEITIAGGKHAMLRHGGAFERAAAQFTARHLLG